MQKALVNTVIYSLMAKWIRLGQVITSLNDEALSRQAAYDPQRSIRQALQKQIEQQQQDVLKTTKPLWEKLNNDNSISGDDILTFMDQVVGPRLVSLANISQHVQQLHHNKICPEVGMFRREVVNTTLDKRFTQTGITYKAFGKQPVTSEIAGLPSNEQPLIEKIDLINATTPLGWSDSIMAFASRWATEQANAASLTEEQQTVLTDGVMLRLLGPAYYFELITNALLNNDTDVLVTTEPFLFTGIQRFNSSDKSVILLHEACERYRQLNKGTPSSNTLEGETTSQVYRLIEKGLPDALAFRAKSFQRALPLQHILADGVLLSASTVYPRADISENLAKHNKDSIYEHLRYIAEAPNSAREIINAGWVYVLNHSPLILQECFNSTVEAGINHFDKHISQLDTLLLKSIETAEVHRMLQRPVPV